MPKNSKVGRCVSKVQKTGKSKGSSIAICQASCQASTGMSYKTGRKPKGKRSK